MTGGQPEVPARPTGPSILTAADLMAFGDGAIATWALQAAATLGVADALAGGPLDAAAIADRTGTHAPALERLLRYLASVGVLEGRGDGRFDLTEVGTLLRSDVDGSLKAWFVMNGPIWRTFFDAPLDSLRTGRPAFAAVMGAPFFDHARRDPAWGAAFDEAMAGAAYEAAAAVVGACDVHGARRIVDVGGGRGHLLAAVLAVAPEARGVVFDLPHVVERSRSALGEAGLLERVEVVGGDFFEAVPAGGDLYLLSWVLHDWDDDEAVRILRSCRAAVAGDGRLLVIESVLPEGYEPHLARSLDLVMLVTLSGRERTLAEYEALLAVAGFRVARMLRTAGPMDVIEAIPG